MDCVYSTGPERTRRRSHRMIHHRHNIIMSWQRNRTSGKDSKFFQIRLKKSFSVGNKLFPEDLKRSGFEYDFGWIRIVFRINGRWVFSISAFLLIIIISILYLQMDLSKVVKSSDWWWQYILLIPQWMTVNPVCPT